jgi:hypothetical protein
MNKQFAEILLKLEILTEAVKSNTAETRKLRLKLNSKKRETAKTAFITHPEILYEYPSMTVNLDAKQWRAVKDGKIITVRGNGYDYTKNLDDDGVEPHIDWDYWTFNKTRQGSVEVILMELDFNPPEIDIFSGSLNDCKIVETEVKSTRASKAERKKLP